MRIRGLMPFACKSPDPNPCMPFIVNFYFLIRALEVSVLYSLRSWIKMQCTVLNVKPSGLSWLCLPFWLVRPFLNNSLKALVMGTATNGFPSIISVLQHLVFKMSFCDVLFTAPSPLPGGDEKVTIFQRSFLKDFFYNIDYVCHGLFIFTGSHTPALVFRLYRE